MLGQPPSGTPPLPFQSTIQELQVTSAEGGVGTLWVGCLWDSVSNQFCWLLSHPSAWFWHPSVSVFVSERVSHHCPMISVHNQRIYFSYGASHRPLKSGPLSPHLACRRFRIGQDEARSWLVAPFSRTNHSAQGISCNKNIYDSFFPFVFIARMLCRKRKTLVRMTFSLFLFLKKWKRPDFLSEN